MENKAKKKSVFNIFDIVLAVILIALAIVFLASRRPAQNAPVEETGGLTENMVVYTVEITGMQNGSAHMIRVGDKLIERSHKWDLGTVTAVEVVPTTRRTQNIETNQFKDAETHLTETAIITLVAACTEDDASINVSGSQTIKVGASVRMNGPGYYGSATVIGIERGNFS